MNKQEFTQEFVSKFSVESERAEKVFAKLDRDGSGEVCLDEIRKLFKDMDEDGK